MYNAPLYSFKEPGLGLYFIICIAQFVVGSIIITLIEKKISFKSCCNDKSDNESKLTQNVSEIVFNNSSLNLFKLKEIDNLENDVADEALRIQAIRVYHTKIKTKEY